MLNLIDYKNDKPTILDKNKKIKRLFTISDVHIKNNDEHDAKYYKIFDTLFDQLKNKKIGENDVIVLLGDILDDGIFISGSAIKLAYYLYNGLSCLCETITILGNHEDKLKIDTLSPLLKIMQSKNKNYILLTSGVYLYGNIAFCYTKHDATNTILCDGYEKYTTISLYHGMLNGSKLENSHKSRNKFSLKDFNTDYCIFGDIHTFQFLNKNETAFYVGSLIQLKMNDKIDHGFCILDLDKKKVIFEKVNNIYKKLDLVVDKYSKVVNCDIDSILNNDTKYADIRVTYESNENNCNYDIIKNFFDKKGINITSCITKYDYEPIRFDKLIEIDGKNTKLSDINSKDDFINFYLNYTTQKENDIDILKQLLVKILNESNFDENLKPKKNLKFIELEINDVMSYGKNVIVFFEKINGMYGICQNNSMGKSTLCEMISLVLFGRTPRCTNEHSFIRKNQHDCSCILKLISNNIYYEIKRTIKIKKQHINENSEAIIEIIKYMNSAKTEYIAYTNDDDVIKSSKYINFVKKSKKDIIEFVEREIISFDELYENIIVSQDRCASFIKSKKKSDLLLKIANLSFLGNIITETKSFLRKEKNLFSSNLDEIDEIFLCKINDLKTTNNTKDVIFNKVKQSVENMKKQYDENINDINAKYLKIEKEYNKCTDECIKYEEKLNYFSEYKKMDNINIDDIETDIKNIEDQLNNTQEINIKNELDNKEKKYMLIDNKIKTLYLNIENKKKEFDNQKMNKINVLKNEIQQLKNNIKIIDDAKKLSLSEYNKIVDNYKSKNNLIKSIESEIFEINEKIKLCQDNNIVVDYKKFVDNNIDIVVCDKLLEYFEQINECDIDDNTKKFFQNQKKEILKKKMNHKKVRDMKKFKDFEETIKLFEKINKNKDDLIVKIDELQKEASLCFKLIENYNNNILNNSIEKKIKMLTDKIHKLENQTLKPYDNYLKIFNEFNNLKDEIYQHKIELQKETNKNIILKHELEKKINILDKINCDKTKYKMYCDIKETYDDLYNDKQKLYKKYDKIRNEKNLENDNKTFNNKYILASELIKKMNTNLKNIQILNNILNSLDNNGLCDTILKKQIVPALQKSINEICDYINHERIHIDILIKDENNIKKYEMILSTVSCVDILNAGGFKTNVIELILKLSFLRINGYFKCDFIIIDEIFDACSMENIEMTLKLIDFFKTQYSKMLVVSHNLNIIGKFDKRLTIIQSNNGNYIQGF